MQLIVSEYTPSTSARSLHKKSISELDALDAYLLLMTNGFSKEIYSNSDSKEKRDKGKSILDKALYSTDATTIANSLMEAGVKNKTIDLLEKVIPEINFGQYEYDDKL